MIKRSGGGKYGRWVTNSTRISSERGGKNEREAGLCQGTSGGRIKITWRIICKNRSRLTKEEERNWEGEAFKENGRVTEEGSVKGPIRNRLLDKKRGNAKEEIYTVGKKKNNSCEQWKSCPKARVKEGTRPSTLTKEKKKKPKTRRLPRTGGAEN